MGTRGGDMDPGVHALVVCTLGPDLAQVVSALYHNSGLTALSGIGSDLREFEVRARVSTGSSRARVPGL